MIAVLEAGRPDIHCAHLYILLRNSGGLCLDLRLQSQASCLQHHMRLSSGALAARSQAPLASGRLLMLASLEFSTFRLCTAGQGKDETYSMADNY